LQKAKDKIETILKKGHQEKFITKSELDAMLPSEKGPGKFYQLFKVHKNTQSPIYLLGALSSVAVDQSLKTSAYLLTTIQNI